MKSEQTRTDSSARRSKATPITIGSIALLLLLTLVGGRSTGALAQLTPVASPQASPTTGECVAPDAAADVSGTPAAAGTPEPLTGTPVDASVEEEVIAAAQNFVFCYNAGDIETLGQLVTPNLLLDLFGIEDPATAGDVLAEAELLPITVLGLGDVQSYEDGRFGLNLQYLLGDYQVVAATHYFVEVDGQYLVDEEKYDAAILDGDSTLVSLLVSDDAPLKFDQGADDAGNREVPSLPLVNAYINNTSTSQQIYQVYALAAGSEATPISEGVADDAMLVGRLSLAPGEAATMYLTQLPIGGYAIVGDDGTGPTLIITEPVSI
ncbi:MAG: hypothetical protein M3462_10795 [Chloroflexota bacterium]|nr:hypothetical protein [Chloroflexota bacterium]